MAGLRVTIAAADVQVQEHTGEGYVPAESYAPLPQGYLPAGTCMR